MQPHKKRSAILEQLNLFRPKPTRPKWESLPTRTKKHVTSLLAQLIVDNALTRASSDQKELIDE